LGIAYQIYDDLVDFYGQEERIGKTLGTDFRSGKLTLPLLVLEERLEGPDRAALLEEITGQRSPDLAGRRRQMVRHGVFGVVNGSIESAMAAGEAALAPYTNLPPVPLLRQLDAALRLQVASLQPSA
jgi:octaprenyl-diphosphate synthase